MSDGTGNDLGTPKVEERPRKKAASKKKAAEKVVEEPLTAARLLELAGKLPPAEIERMQQFGAVLPQGVEVTDTDIPSDFGYVCGKCYGIALRFVGRGPWIYGGQAHKIPPIMPLAQIAWTQDKVIPNRVTPLCQHCGALVELNAGGQLLPDRIRRIEDWQQVIDRAYNRFSADEADVEFEGPQGLHRVEGPAGVRRKVSRLDADLQSTSQSFEQSITTDQALARGRDTKLGLEPGSTDAAQMAAAVERTAEEAGVMEHLTSLNS